MDRLSRQTILELIDEAIQKKLELEIHQQIDSTNSYLLDQSVSDNIKICLAESQTRGRGRYGKNWLSPTYSNIYLSLAYRFKKSIHELSGLSLVIGIVVAETLQSFCDYNIGVKWPNDLLVNGKKLSGILIEIKNQKNGFCNIVTGIGINVFMSESEMGAISGSCISLNQCNPKKILSRNAIVAELLTNILHNLEIFDHSGFSLFHQKWNNLDIWKGHIVELMMGSNKITGIHRGVDLNGALILEQEGKLSSWNSGEISLRRTDNAVTD